MSGDRGTARLRSNKTTISEGRTVERHQRQKGSALHRRDRLEKNSGKCTGAKIQGREGCEKDV